MDPLSLLREFLINDRINEIKLTNENVFIGNKKFPKSAKTSYRILYQYYNGDKKETQQYYNLGAILYLLENEDLKYSEYAQKATAEKVQVVEFPDKNDLLAYVRGEIPASKSVEKSTESNVFKRPGNHALEHQPCLKRSRQEEIKFIEQVRIDPRCKSRKIVPSPTVSNGDNCIVDLELERLISAPICKSNENDRIVQRDLNNNQTRSKNVSKFTQTAFSPPRQSVESSDYWKSIPIIIIPDNRSSALITMCNAQEILENLNFVSVNDKLALESKQRSFRKFNSLVIRDKNNNDLPELYRLVDEPVKLEKDDWNRVVGIFVVGRAWQFKNWPYNLDQLFTKFPLFYIKYAREPVDLIIKSWPVNIIEISKTDWRRNRAAIERFWKFLAGKSPRSSS